MIRLLQLAALALGLILAGWGLRVLSRPFAPLLGRIGARLGPMAPLLAASLVLFGDLGLDGAGTFGLADRVDETLNRAAGMISGPLYGGLKRPGQRDIVIVALDSNFVEGSGGVWPPPYKATQTVVEQVTRARPKAIFLDFYYNQPRRGPNGWPDIEGANNLAAAMARAQAAKIPMLIGPVSPDQPVLQPIARAATSVGVTSDDDGQPFAYSLEDDQERPMAATALYRIWAADRKKTPRLPANILSIDWGFGASAWMKARLNGEYAFCVAPTYPDRIGKFFELFGRAVAPNLAPAADVVDGLVITCPYFDIVPAAALSDPIVQKRLNNSIVLIGATVPWVRDQAPTPLLGEVPGVMVHAMALDNLIQYGANATRYPASHPRLLKLDDSDLVNAALMTAGFLATWFLHRLMGLAPDEALPFGLKLRIWLAIAVIGVVVAGLSNWPLFKLVSAALTGGICLEAWDEFQKHRHRRHAEGSGE
jgi:hypothetical protein